MYYGGVVSNQTEHQKCVGHTIACFQERGIRCEDNETRVGDASAKRSDLILPDFDTLLEAKTFKPKQQELQEVERMKQEGLSVKVSGSGVPDIYDRFDDDLSHSRKKFRECPDYQPQSAACDYSRGRVLRALAFPLTVFSKSAPRPLLENSQNRNRAPPSPRLRHS